MQKRRFKKLIAVLLAMLLAFSVLNPFAKSRVKADDVEPIDQILESAIELTEGNTQLKQLNTNMKTVLIPEPGGGNREESGTLYVAYVPAGQALFAYCNSEDVENITVMPDVNDPDTFMYINDFCDTAIAVNTNDPNEESAEDIPVYFFWTAKPDTEINLNLVLDDPDLFFPSAYDEAATPLQQGVNDLENNNDDVLIYDSYWNRFNYTKAGIYKVTLNKGELALFDYRSEEEIPSLYLDYGNDDGMWVNPFELRGVVNPDEELLTVYVVYQGYAEDATVDVTIGTLDEYLFDNIVADAPYLDGEGSISYDPENAQLMVVENTYWVGEDEITEYQIDFGVPYRIKVPSGQAAVCEMEMTGDKPGENGFFCGFADFFTDNDKCSIWHNDDDGNVDENMKTAFANFNEEERYVSCFLGGNWAYDVNVSFEPADGYLLESHMEDAPELVEGDNEITLSEDAYPVIVKEHRREYNKETQQDDEWDEYRSDEGILYKLVIPAGKMAVCTYSDMEDLQQDHIDAWLRFYKNISSGQDVGGMSYNANYNGEEMEMNDNCTLSWYWFNDLEEDEVIYVFANGNVDFKLNYAFYEGEDFMIHNQLDSMIPLEEGDNTISYEDAIVSTRYWYDWNGQQDVLRYETDQALLLSAVVPAGMTACFVSDQIECAIFDSFDEEGETDFYHHFWSDNETPLNHSYANTTEEDQTVYFWVRYRAWEHPENLNISFGLSSAEDYLINNQLDLMIPLEEGDNTISFENRVTSTRFWNDWDGNKNTVRYETDNVLLLSAEVPAGKIAHFTSEDMEGAIHDTFDQEGNIDFYSHWWNNRGQLNHYYANLSEDARTIYFWVRYNDGTKPENFFINFSLEDAEDYLIEKTLNDSYELELGENDLSEYDIRAAVIKRIWHDWENDEDVTEVYTRTGTLFRFEVAPKKAVKLNVDAGGSDIWAFLADDTTNVDTRYNGFERLFTNNDETESLTVYFWLSESDWGDQADKPKAVLTEYDAAAVRLENHVEDAIELGVGNSVSRDFSDSMLDELVYARLEWNDEAQEAYLVDDTRRGVLFKLTIPDSVTDTAIQIGSDLDNGEWFDALIYEELSDGQLVVASTYYEAADRIYYWGEAKTLYIFVIGPDYMADVNDDTFTLSTEDVTGRRENMFTDVPELPYQQLLTVTDPQDVIYDIYEDACVCAAVKANIYVFDMSDDPHAFDVTIPRDDEHEVAVGFFEIDPETGAPGRLIGQVASENEAAVEYTIQPEEGDPTRMYVLAAGDGKFAIGDDLPPNEVFTDLLRYNPKTGKMYYYYDSVLYCNDKGIMSGYKDAEGNLTGEFGLTSKDTLTKGQLILMLYRLAEAETEYDECIFADVNKKASGEEPFYFQACQWGYDNGIITGRESGGKLYFSPKEVVTRADCASMLMKYAIYAGFESEDSVQALIDSFDLSQYKDEIKGNWRKNALRYAGAKGIITGSVKADGTYANALGELTRKDAATIFARFMKTYIPEEEPNNIAIITSGDK